jgi:hypothetical protein
MEHASDVLSPRPVQTPQELNLEKLAKRKTKKTRLSFKQGTAEHAISDQVIRCWFAKREGGRASIGQDRARAPGSISGTSKPRPMASSRSRPSRPTSRSATLRYWESQSAVARATCRR